MSHKLVSLYIGDGEYYTRTDVDNVIADKCEAWIRLDVSPRHTHRFIRWYKIWLELAEKFKEAY